MGNGLELENRGDWACIEMRLLRQPVVSAESPHNEHMRSFKRQQRCCVSA